MSNLLRLWPLAGLAVLAACASTDMGVRTAGDRPEDLSTTEASFWYQTNEAERRLRASGRLNSDPELNAYVSDMVCEVSGEFCQDLRIYVVETPAFNASMAPNGMALVNTGLLLRAETADQLGFVLGHEFVHFEENHALERHAALRNANVTATVLSSAISAAGGGGLGSVGALMAYGEAFAFTREQEAEADAKGLHYATQAGYAPAAGARIWENLLAELEASDHEEVTRAGQAGGFLGTHPDIVARIEALRGQASGNDQAEHDAHAYRAVIRPFLQDWLDMQIVRRDYGATLHLVDRLAELETDLGVLNYARGRVYALRGEAGDADAALDAYLAAIAHPDAPADAWRGLGELYRADGLALEAADAFATYLDHAPDARDRYLIQSLIADLRGTSE